MKKENCSHPEYATQPGERYPLPDGPAETIECTLCNAFKLDRSIGGTWQEGPLQEKAQAIRKQVSEEL